MNKEQLDADVPDPRPAPCCAAPPATDCHNLRLLRPVPKHPGIVLYPVIDANIGNSTLARMQFERIDAA